MTDKKKKDKRHSPSPPSAVSKFHLEAHRSVNGMSVVIGGVLGISDFSPECVLLKGHGGKVTVLGKHLNISIYEGRVVEVLGKVEDIKFSYGKN